MLTIEEIEKKVAAGLVNRRDHPTLPLRLYDYSREAQFGRHWDEVTLQCRGIVMDDNGTVIARPLRKFFNLGEPEAIVPDGPFEVFEKVDGSMVLLYYYQGEWITSTRGSFISWQAMMAKEIIFERYNPLTFDPSYTYIFEFLHPENRIVVSYGDDKKVVLLTAIETFTGEEVPYDHLKKMIDNGALQFELANRYDFESMDAVLAFEAPNAEGFVLRWEDGYRLKVKFAEYVRLHKILTGISPRTIWESLAEGKTLVEALGDCPDEFYDWARGVEKGLIEKYQEIELEAIAKLAVIGMTVSANAIFPTQKDWAMEIVKSKYQSVLFAMKAGKPYAPIIWKMVRPEGGPVFASTFGKGEIE